jgi:uncharacterized membrane protein YtjA (UPF0391 family)
MLGAAFSFLVIAIIAGILGFGGIASFSLGIAKFLFFIAIALFIIFLILGTVASKKFMSMFKK